MTKNLFAPQIENCLLMCDVFGRFDGDVEYLEFVRNQDKTEADVKRMVALLRRALNSGVKLGFRLRDDL